ncbi:MAG: hypothetical protein IT406_00740 [Candidatus Yanofskybacteria bacterium]|nr:hypothetical protein [Candidatus Yanofskybacteria bacterium]
MRRLKVKHLYRVTYQWAGIERVAELGAADVLLDGEPKDCGDLVRAIVQQAPNGGEMRLICPLGWQKYSEPVGAPAGKAKQEKSVDLGELKDETTKLLALLEDPQPGTMAWNDFMRDRLQNLHALIAPVVST